MQVSLNYVPGSATDLLLSAAAEAQTIRAVRIIIPDNDGPGTPAWQWTTSGFVKRYSPDNMEPNSPMTATAVIRITGAITQAAETSEAAS